MLHKAFKSEDKFLFRWFIENNPGFIPQHISAMEHNGKIIAANVISELNTYINGKVYKMGCIGQVGTLKQYRGKGIGGKLLEHCKKTMKELNIDYSLLFAGPVQFYKKHGWKSLKVASHKFEKISIKPVAKGNIIPYSLEYMYQVYDIHYNFIKNFNLTVIRNFLYWEFYLRRFKARPAKIYLLKTGSKIAAYIMVMKHQKAIRLFEYAALERNNENHFLKLMDYVLKKYKADIVYIPNACLSYIPVKALKKNSHTLSLDYHHGFMMHEINRKFNWKEIEKKILFFDSDGF